MVIGIGFVAIPSRTATRLLPTSEISKHQTVLSLPTATPRLFILQQRIITSRLSPGALAIVPPAIRSRSIHTSPPMGKKKTAEYNDFLDGEKLRDNATVRTSLQPQPHPQQQASTSSEAHHVEPPRTRQDKKGRGKAKGSKKGPKKPQLTHFLCLPLVNPTSLPQLEENLQTLRRDIADSNVVPQKAIRPVGTLHLTLGVMSLDDEEIEPATTFLRNLDLERILRDTTGRTLAAHAAESGSVAENLSAAALPDAHALSVDLEALVPMQKADQTSILYAEPRDRTGRLVSFAEAVKRVFLNEGWLVEDRRTLRLHATVVNTIYAKPKGRRRKVNHRDASQRQGTLAHSSSMDQPPHDNDDDDDDGASTAGSVQDIADEQVTAPPDPSTGETQVAATRSPFDGSDGHGPHAKSWMRFDARDLVARYENFAWAKDVRIDRVQICRMGAKKILDEAGEVVAEEYEVVAEKVI